MRLLKIISISVHQITFKESINQVMSWALNHQSSFVCFANVHMTIEAFSNSFFLEQINKASLVLADGQPIAKACKWLHGIKQERIAGMDFMPKILEAANQVSAKIFLFGSSDIVLEKLSIQILEKFPMVKLVGAISPPYRVLTDQETEEHIASINQSNANFVFVALGCPKQEKWMANNSQKIQAVLLGLGGAFSILAGTQKRAPRWMQKTGLEWLYRLVQEPKRLFKRYFVTNSLFILLLIKELLINNFIEDFKIKIFK